MLPPILDDTALKHHQEHLEHMCCLRDKVLRQEIPLRSGPRVQVQTRLAAYTSSIEELNQAIRTYLNLKSGLQRKFTFTTLDDIGLILIQARIARGWSQAELARSLGITPQYIARAEADFYRRATLNERQKVAQALHLHIKGKTATLLKIPRNVRV